jgi:hypothetical protein
MMIRKWEKARPSGLTSHDAVENGAAARDTSLTCWWSTTQSTPLADPERFQFRSTVYFSVYRLRVFMPWRRVYRLRTMSAGSCTVTNEPAALLVPLAVFELGGGACPMNHSTPPPVTKSLK